MLRSSVVLTGVLACGIEPAGFPVEAASEAASSATTIEREPAGAVPGIPTADRFLTIAVPRADCECSRSRSVTTPVNLERIVRLVDYSGLLPKTREAVADEIIRLSAGRQIDVSEAADADSDRGDTIYALLRPGKAPVDVHSRQERARGADDAPLAWSLFQQDRPASLVFVWVGAVQELLDNSSIEGRRLTHWHVELRRALLARALGRVVVHEIGHLMCGRSHSQGGLMKRRFTTDDLLWRTTPLTGSVQHRACDDVPSR